MSFLIIQIHYRLLIKCVLKEIDVNWGESGPLDDIGYSMINHVTHFPTILSKPIKKIEFESYLIVPP